MSAARRGRLIVFEGAEGVGKSTQLGLLRDRLEATGVPCLAVREPGQTVVGEEIRRLVLDKDHPLAPAAEALLFMAARAQLLADVVRPALAEGRAVLADRFFLSTYAYQAAGRGLPLADVAAANRLATGGLVPDLTLLFDLPDGEGLRRTDRRGKRDRIERAEDEFHRSVIGAFRSFADPGWQRAHPEVGPIVRIDAVGAETDVAGRVGVALAERWPETFASLAGSQ